MPDVLDQNVSDTEFDDEDDDDEDDDDEEDYEEEERMACEPIKLRRPTPGSKIADLTNIIEAQVSVVKTTRRSAV